MVDWNDANDGSAGARLVEDALAKAQANPYGASVRQLDETEEAAVAEWRQLMRAFHSAPGALPIRYMGGLYNVGVDGTLE